MRGARRRQPDVAAVELLAVDREEQRIAVRITGDELDVEAERVARDGRDVVAGGALGRAAEHQRRTAGTTRVRDRPHVRILAHEQKIGVVGIARRGAEPGQFAWVESYI